MAVILVADDEPAIRKLVSDILRRAGHEVLTAANGVEAVAVFRSYPDQIHLVITDLVMPVMDGSEAIRRIRETRPKTRILCMSGYSAKEHPPGTALLSKPFSFKALLDSVGQILSSAPE